MANRCTNHEWTGNDVALAEWPWVRCHMTKLQGLVLGFCTVARFNGHNSSVMQMRSHARWKILMTSEVIVSQQNSVLSRFGSCVLSVGLADLLYVWNVANSHWNTPEETLFFQLGQRLIRVVSFVMKSGCDCCKLPSNAKSNNDNNQMDEYCWLSSYH